MNFTHLHVHTEYSVLDGFSNVKKLIKRTKELGMSAVAITDHGSMFGTTEFFQTAKAEGVKPIIGLETYIAPRRMFDKDSKIDRKAYHLILLAQDMTGYKNLLKIASASQLEGFYYHPRIDHEFLSAHSEGLIATNACLAGELQQAYLTGGMESAIKVADWYRGVFGDRFYFEIQDHANVPRLDEATKATIELAKRYGGKIIATNDVHYVNKEDAKLQDILLALQTGKTLNDPGRLSMGDDSYYLRSPDEMMQIFNYIPEAITNTIEIADRCNVDLTPEGYQLPQYPVPEGNSQSYLRDLCEKGLREKYGANADDQKVRERFEYELDVIHTMGFDDYFLIVWDICKEATNRNIWYNARGSAAGSIVAFALNITSVEPLGFGLIFERFLNPGRVSMPDIDLDFQDDRRGEMMTYCVEKYGEERVANIVTFGRMKAKAAIRDVGRVLDIPISKVDKIAKLIPESPSATIDKALTEIDELQRLYDNDESVKAILDLAKGMEGAIRSLGTHACGVVVTPDNITNHVALAKHVNPDGFTPIPHVAQTDMFAVDITGLLKVDFLGLATLTIMNNACQLIKERHGVDIGLESIPTDDPATYELLGEGDTTAVFQFESAGMKKYLQSMKPNRLENAIAMVALYRPGPMDFIPHYISRMHGDEKVEYLHEKLEPIFSETYGIPVYQEQIMFAAIDLAGYTASESDDLRKAISKKKADKIAKHRTKFITGCIGNGIEKETAEAIFTEWENFARYGFNKSHAAAYGIMAVKAAYLKKHFPVEFMASVLSVFRGDKKKVTVYMADCRRHGIEILPPNVNKGGWDFAIEEVDGKPAIRFGMGAIKNVGDGAVRTIVSARNKKPFVDLDDFVTRVAMNEVGKRAIESMIMAGALDDFGSRRSLLAVVEEMMKTSKSSQNNDNGQISLFDMMAGGDQYTAHITLPDLPNDGEEQESLLWEKDLVGLYISGHPIEAVADLAEAMASHFSDEIAELETDKKVTVAGIITNSKKHVTKGGKAMGFVTVEDLHGEIEIIVFPASWKKHEKLLQEDKIIVIEGRVEGDGKAKIILEKVSLLQEDTTTKDKPDTSSSFNKQFKDVSNYENDDFDKFSLEDQSAEERPPKAVEVLVVDDGKKEINKIIKKLVKHMFATKGEDTLTITIQGENISELKFVAQKFGLTDQTRRWIKNNLGAESFSEKWLSSNT